MLNNRKCSSKTFSGRKVFLIIKFTNCDSQEKNTLKCFFLFKTQTENQENARNPNRIKLYR